MKKVAFGITAVITTVLFTSSSFAIGLKAEVKPEFKVKMETEMKVPGKVGINQQGAAKTGAGFGQGMKSIGAGAANQNVDSKTQCDPGQATTDLMAGTKLSYAEAEFALSNGLAVQACADKSVDDQGLLNMKDPNAREVAARTVIFQKNLGLSGPEALAKAKNVVIAGSNTTGAQEVENYNTLVSGGVCKVFKNN